MTDQEKIEAVRRAARLVKTAEEALDAIICDAFPVGARVFYQTHNSLLRMVVVDHLYGGRLRLRNVATGKERRIDGRDSALSL